MLNLDSSQTNALIVMSCAYKEIVYFHGILEPYQPEQYSLRLGSRLGLPVSWTHRFHSAHRPDARGLHRPRRRPPVDAVSLARPRAPALHRLGLSPGPLRPVPSFPRSPASPGPQLPPSAPGEQCRRPQCAGPWRRRRRLIWGAGGARSAKGVAGTADLLSQVKALRAALDSDQWRP